MSTDPKPVGEGDTICVQGVQMVEKPNWLEPYEIG